VLSGSKQFDPVHMTSATRDRLCW